MNRARAITRGRSEWLGIDWVAVVGSWLVARVAVGLGYAIAESRAGEPPPLPLDQGLLAWDGSWYQWIADFGFAGAPEGAIRFFPAYPLLGRWLGEAVGSDVALALISNLLALACAALLYRLARREFGPEVAERSVWWLALFPAAFVLVFAYSESLFLALTLAAMLSIRDRRWLLGAGFALLASLTRPTGILLVVFVLLEARDDRRGAVWEQVTAALAPVAGLVAFLAWSDDKFGSWRAPLDAQREIRGSFHEPISRVVKSFNRGFGGDQSEMLHGLSAIVFVTVVLLIAKRVPLSYTVYALAGIAMGLAATTINSFERYGLGLVPVLLGLGALRIDRRLHVIALGGSMALMIGLTALAFDGTYVP